MESFDYAVIGAGPGGYVSAIRAAQLGLKTALIEKNERLGGTCLNIGCIPSKALLESSEHYHTVNHALNDHGISVQGATLDVATMMNRKQKVVMTLTDGIVQLMKKNKVTVFHGAGKLTSEDTIAIEGENGTEEIKAANICIATGSVPVELPFMKFNGSTIVSSTEALSFDKVPEHLIVIGAGAIGLEMGSVWARLGAKVTVIEMLPQIVPFAEKQLASALQKSLQAIGMEFHLGAKVTGAEDLDGKVKVSFTDKKSAEHEVVGDVVLVAVGRKPYSENVGLETVGIQRNDRGQVNVDDHWRTGVGNIYAIGDIVDGPMLAHKAEEEGVAVAEIIAGKPGHVNYDVIPNVVYTEPELAQVGLTTAQAKEKGFEVAEGKFYFRGNGRALSMEAGDGLVKIVADQNTDKVLGVHILGPRASELIAEAAVAMEFSASSEDIARTCHAHPTLSEAVKEAALAVDKRSIHS